MAACSPDLSGHPFYNQLAGTEVHLSKVTYSTMRPHKYFNMCVTLHCARVSLGESLRLLLQEGSRGHRDDVAKKAVLLLQGSAHTSTEIYNLYSEKCFG